MGRSDHPIKEDGMNENGQPAGKPRPLYVTLILDETGSMQDCKGAAIAGFNQYVATLRDEPAETQFTLTLFNSSKMEVRYESAPIARVKNLTGKMYKPNDTTPLYDAIGRTLAVARAQAPAGMKKFCGILTDGMENASREYTRKQIFDLIKACEKEGWTFIYLGADHDVWAAGEQLGIAGDNLISFCRSDVGRTFKQLSQATARHRRNGTHLEDQPEPEA
jgi:hypothetical protein